MQPFPPDDADGRPWTIPPTGSRRPPRPPRPRWLLFGCLPALLLAVVALIVGALVLARNGDGTIQRSNGTALPASPPSTNVPGSAAVTSSCAVQQGLVTRDCAIITPPGLAAGTRLPVVFLLHGMGDGPGSVRDAGAWTDAVIARRFMLVTPSGVANSWNAGACCGLAKATDVDDTSYLATLVDEISRRPDVDPDRIYMAGFSNGGMMTYRFSCVSDRLAGMASVGGTKVITCPPKRALPILHIHGTGDETVPYQGGSGIAAAIMGVTFPAVPATVEQVAADDGCTAAPSKRASGELTIEEWSGCGNDARVRFITIAGWPHQWPLTGPLDATTEVLDFFAIR